MPIDFQLPPYGGKADVNNIGVCAKRGERPQQLTFNMPTSDKSYINTSSPRGGREGAYSFQQKGDHLTIFKNKKKMHTPKGNIIYTYDEALANRIIEQLEAEADYTSCSSLLCYHYTYCDLTAEYDQKTVAEDLLTCLEHNVEYDPFIAFCEEKAIEAMSDEEADQMVKAFKQQMMAFIASCSMYQLVAITVLYCAFDSLALPYYIIKETMGETACSIDDFMAKLSAYCKREEISIPADMPATISAFCEYWKL